MRAGPGGSRTSRLNTIAAQLALKYPTTSAGVQARVIRFGEQQVGRLSETSNSLVVIATAVFVLLIACANVANLLLARSAGRAREMSIRALVGATRWRIVRQLLVESVLLALAGGALGLWLWLFVRRGMAPLAIGLVIGLPAALIMGGLLRGLLIQITATDPVTLITIVALLMVVVSVACWLPARRAARLDPLAVLRSE